MALLEVRDLVKRYATQPALDGVGFDLRQGEALGLIGESGCGKSTLCSLLARLADPTLGRIVFDGIDIGGVTARKASRASWRPRIQLVFQDPHESLDPSRTAFDAIAAPQRLLRGLKGSKLRASVLRIAERVQLPAVLLERRPHELSGGQAARVGIARALVLEPELLILDEPTSALDVSGQAVVLQLLDRLRREMGLTYLLVSHDLHVVRLLCQRVMVMQRGRIVETGDARSVFETPRHPCTQALVAALPRPPGATLTRLMSGRSPGEIETDRSLR